VNVPSTVPSIFTLHVGAGAAAITLAGVDEILEQGVGKPARKPEPWTRTFVPATPDVGFRTIFGTTLKVKLAGVVGGSGPGVPVTIRV